MVSAGGLGVWETVQRPIGPRVIRVPRSTRLRGRPKVLQSSRPNMGVTVETWILGLLGGIPMGPRASAGPITAGRRSGQLAG